MCLFFVYYVFSYVCVLFLLFSIYVFIIFLLISYFFVYYLSLILSQLFRKFVRRQVQKHLGKVQFLGNLVRRIHHFLSLPKPNLPFPA